VMVTPEASMTPDSLTCLSAAVRSPSLQWARHMGASASRTPMHPSCSQVSQGTSARLDISVLRFNATSFAAYIASGGLVSPEAKVPGAPVVGGTVMIAKGLYLTMH
jgi:hypothetical protein